MPKLAEDLAVFYFLHHPKHLRMTGQCASGGVSKSVERSEPPSEVCLLFRRQMLIPEHDHKMLEQSRPNGRDDGIIEWLGEVDTKNLGAKGARKRSYIHDRRFVEVQGGGGLAMPTSLF